MQQNLFFTYDLSNLLLADPSLIIAIIGLVIGVILMIVVYLISLGFYGYALLQKDEYEFRKKKETLQDLILMKDIQSEMEREMDLALTLTK